jgi:YidC/Oxa1 family membrane protein insertase
LHFAAIPLLGPISEFFAKVLQFFNSFTGNFGVNVILLTVAFRIVVLPLSIKQTKSMIAMQRLQPQLKEIQKKYKDDREKQGQEMMRLYKENKVSPLGGCLPLILQLPILFALFEVLRNAPKYVHYSTSFSFLGINNLIATGKVMWTGGKISVFSTTVNKVVTIPYRGHEYAAVIVLILLTIATGYVSAKMMTNDPKQAKMMALMPVIFGVFAWILPAGVTLYIIVTNVLMVVQQYIQLEAEGFYDEKRAMRLKAGDPLKWYERYKFKFYDYGSIVLTAVRIKRRGKLEEVKPAAKGQKAPAAKGGKPPQGKKAVKRPAAAGKKPAAKKPTGAPRPQKPSAPETKAEDGDTGTKDEEPAVDEEKQAQPDSKPAAMKADKAKQYPAKKHGSRKK